MKILHQLLKGISLTGALFVFQACYGMPQPPFEEEGRAPMSFTLVSHADGKPMAGVSIRASVSSYAYPHERIGVTDENGKCQVEIPYNRDSGSYLEFQAPGEQFAIKDTTLTDLRERDILIKLDPVK